MKQKALIVDLDGTFCDSEWRSHLFKEKKWNWAKINEMAQDDKAFPWCDEIIHKFAQDGYIILFVTARTGDPEGWKTSYDWLCGHTRLVPDADWKLIMRKPGDFRSDWLIKQELYFELVEPSYDVLFCLEDRINVATMWRELGLVCLHCDTVTTTPPVKED